MLIQAQINFSIVSAEEKIISPPSSPTFSAFSVHEFEKGQQNQKILDKNRDKFSKRCQQVFDLLITGNAYTTRQLDNLLNMTDSRKRLSDLIKINGVKISGERLLEDRYKLHWMTEFDLEFNRKMFLRK